jgi:hypothetical protein
MYANTDSLTDQFFAIYDEQYDDSNFTNHNESDDDYSGDDEFYREFYGD